MITKSQARRLREMIEKLSAGLDDDTAETAPQLFPAWSGAGVDYAAGDRVCYDGVLYKVLIAHKSQTDWTPDVAVSLFAKLLSQKESGAATIPEWVQPDSTNPYHKGDKVMHDGSVWESLIDGNVWEPCAINSALWRKLD